MTDFSRATVNQSLQEARERILQYQQHSFQDLLTYVWKHSTFYRDYYQSYGMREGDLPDVSVRDLPFISKEILMENFDTAVTDRRLRRRELEEWIQQNRDPRQRFHEDFIVIHSSGSSGNIGIFVYDRTAWQVMNSTMAGHLPIPQNTPSQKTKIAFYIASHGHFAGVITAVQMPESVYDVLIISLLDRSEQIIEQLNSFQPHRLIGYSSSITDLADLALQDKLHIQPQRIFVSGDPLTHYMEQKIQRAWAVPVHNLYATSESIFLAVKESGQEEMTVLEDLNILEVLDDRNQPVSPGEQGRVVLTNLYNFTLPILRYELGDYVVRGITKHNSSFATIQDIQSVKINDTLPIALGNGKHDTISPRVLSSFYVSGLEKVQFTSTRPDLVEIEYIAQHNIDALIRSEFQRILNMKGAAGTQFVIRQVHHIANDAQTGKLRLLRVEGTQRKQPSIPVENRPAPEFTHGRRVAPTKPFLEFKKEDIEQSIPERFEQQVRRDPHRLAIKVNSVTLTYDELNRAANRIARAVLAQLPGEGTVALLLEHGAPMIAAILGVLKAGKIYVPLDPSYPRARNAHILEDSRAALIITNNKNLPLAKAFAQAQNAPRLINLNESDASRSDQNLGLSLAPDTLAYIYYTSGSTGQPKGVVQNHRNVLHQLMTYTNSLHICADDRLTLLHSCSFSAARLDVFGALLNGATLYPLSIEEGGMAHLANRLMQEEITIYHWVPTPFRHFVGALAGVEEFPKLRLIVLGSESVYPRDVELYKKHFSPDCIFVNRLGTTETGNIRLYFINKGTQISANVVPAGYALEDTEVLLLNDADEEVGGSCIGEIAVKSRHLSPGYWRQPDLTHAAFQPDPKGGRARIYRTGDLGCMLPDGCLMHLGRKDFQVKVRGYRIEIAEIERTLLDSAAVKETVVVAREDEAGDKRLVAYIVPAPEFTLRIGELRRLLQVKLPDYMVPSAFMLLDALPLTPTGKVDRLALPVPDRARPELEDTFVAPRTAVEEVVTGMWAEVLGLEQIGVHDSFFDLGGHSLLATQVMSRIRRAFQVELPLRRFFEAPTITELAVAIEKAKKHGAQRPASAITPVSREAYRIKRSSMGDQRKST